MELLELGFPVLALTLIVLSLSMWLFQRSKGSSSSPPSSTSSQREIIVKEEVVKDDEEEAAKKQFEFDIEDLMGVSLIPSTLKTMKQSHATPLTVDDKREKVAELETHKTTPNFMGHMHKNGVKLQRMETAVFQLNIGYYCNQACSHCHVDSSPKTKTMMTREVAERCLELIERSPSVQIVDLTGGAPELNQEFKFLVEGARRLNKQVIDRCNLTVLLEPHQEHLPQFLADNGVRVVASLPCYLEDNVKKQRGDQIFQRSIKGLKLLNDVGYGKEGSGLPLDLVYNPTGCHLPPAQSKLEGDYKRELKARFGIEFSNLICVTNMPINRYYDYLKMTGDLDKYMNLLVDNFNTGACNTLMCKSYISVDPLGRVFDCDFNQQMDLGIKRDGEDLSVFDIEELSELQGLPIVTRKHCYGCTAGAGSSCGAL